MLAGGDGAPYISGMSRKASLRRGGLAVLAALCAFILMVSQHAGAQPLEPGEQKRFEALMAREPELLGGAQLVVEAMLQSTSFLFRLDDSSDAKARPYVTANRLSYALWDSMPDAELFAAAGRGDLNTAQGVEKATRRMLDHPRAKESLTVVGGAAR